MRHVADNVGGHMVRDVRMQGSSMMKSHRRMAQAFVLLLALLMSGVGALLPGVASARQASGNSYVSKMTGVTIAWNSPWAFDDKDSTADSNSEVVFLNSNGAIVLIGYLPVGIDMNQARDQILATFQQDAQKFTPLDRGSYSNVSYSLDMAALKTDSGQNVDFGVFTLFMGNTGRGATEVYIFLSPVQLFTDEMNSAKSNITIGGTPIFEGVTPGGLQNLLDKNAGASGGSSSSQSQTKTTEKTPAPKPTKAAEPAPTKEASGGLSTDVSLGGSSSDKGSDTSASNKSSSTKSSATKDTTTSTSSTGKVDPALQKLGVTAPGKYTSPQFGAKVTWNTNWAIAQDKQKNPVVTSDASGGVDAIMLDCQVGDGFVFVSIADGSQGSPAQYEQYWSSDTYFQKAGLVNAEVLDSSSTDTDATVLIRHDASETNSAKLIEVMQAHVTADGSAIIITRAVTSLSNTMPDFFLAIANGLTIDGNPPFSTTDAVKFTAEAAT